MSNNHGEIVIEFREKTNANIFFDPLNKTVRGYWDVSKETGRGKRLPTVDVPGMRAGVTIARKCARIFDPLGFPSNQAILDGLNERRGGRLTPTIRACHQETYENLTDNELATWLYWMRRYVKERKAVLVSASAKLEGFDLPGDPLVDNYHDSRHQAPRRLSEFDKIFRSGGDARQEPMVPVEKQGT